MASQSDKGENLSVSRQSMVRKMALLVMEGKSVIEVAQQMQLREETIRKWMKRPHFKMLISKYQDAVDSMVKKQLVALDPLAVRGVKAALMSDDANLVFAAAKEHLKGRGFYSNQAMESASPITVIIKQAEPLMELKMVDATVTDKPAYEIVTKKAGS